MEKSGAETEPVERLHPDDIVSEIFRLQSDGHPAWGGDGDLEIEISDRNSGKKIIVDVQDDMPLVEAWQFGSHEPAVVGQTIQDALEMLLLRTKDPDAYAKLLEEAKRNATR